MPKPKIIVILGPTSSGKTALSIELAKEFGGEIVSADSRQTYRGMNVGTGKVTKQEMQGIPHHLLDVADPKKQFTVDQYAKLAKAAIDGILERGNLPIVCGGTGFYIDTLTSGVVLPEVPPDHAFRAKLSGKSAPELLKRLEKIDPERAKTVDRNNPVRLVRALEIAKALGRVPKIRKEDSPYDILKIGLDMKDGVLQERIRERLDARMQQGMLREAKKLHALGLTWKRMRELGLEYRAMADFLTAKGKPDLAAMRESLSTAIWHYAKRQRQWFRRDAAIVWLDPTKKATLAKSRSLVKKFLKA